jgi:hypothetical protein
MAHNDWEVLFARVYGRNETLVALLKEAETNQCGCLDVSWSDRLHSALRLHAEDKREDAAKGEGQ